jgi:benzylsuccinate CoA-transferase BbsF subunit
MGRVGNHDPNYAPHGVYPAAGDDRWIAIACRTDDHWRALCAALGHPEVADDSRFNTFARRDQNRDALDRLIAEWTRGRDRFEIERALQECGVPAGVVQDSADCAADPQLAARGHFVELPHPVLGKTVIEGPRFHLSRTPGAVERAAPTTGQDRDYVLRNILGYDDQLIRELARAGAFGQDATAQA